jgi:hypothetical protein
VILDKFAPDDAPPPLLLRLVNPLASCFGTEVTRRLGPILRDSGFTVVANQSVAMRGLLRIVLLSKGP